MQHLPPITVSAIFTSFHEFSTANSSGSGLGNEVLISMAFYFSLTNIYHQY